MPDVNLSSLSGQELRRLLDAARARGDAPLAYQILQQMAAHRESRSARGLSLMRRPSEPRVVALNLGDDPTGPEEEALPEPEVAAAAFRPEPEPQPEPVAAMPAPRRSRRAKAQPSPRKRPIPAAPVMEAAPEAEPPPKPRSVWNADPEPVEEEAHPAMDWALHLAASAPRPPRVPSVLKSGAVIGLVAGVTMGAAVGWWAGSANRQDALPPLAPPGAIQTAALTPPPAPVTLPVVAVPAPAPEPPPAAELAASEDAALAAAAEASADNVAAEAIEPVETPAERQTAEAVVPTETPRPIPVRSTEGEGCTAAPTPADREICGHPELQRLQRQLRQAYAEALQAHEDRDLLRQRQLAWREARNTVTEPDRLARLYEQRIRKLNAATAEARGH